MYKKRLIKSRNCLIYQIFAGTLLDRYSQTKTRLVAENFAWVHSVDRIKIATRLNDQRSGQDTPLNICLQVNISEESAKSGTTIDELSELAAFVDQSPNLVLRGLMAIPQKKCAESNF